MESSGREFKLRFNNHNQSFKNREINNKKESSKYIWQLNENPIILIRSGTLQFLLSHVNAGLIDVSSD